MIVSICGKVIYSTSKGIAIECAGIGHFVNCSRRDILRIEIGMECRLRIRQILGDAKNELYGFMSIEDLDMFNTIIKAEMVGPALALKILSEYSASDLVYLIMNDDFQEVEKVQGVGQKALKKIYDQIQKGISK
jgi:Holliday junction DNA helicase RuvA